MDIRINKLTLENFKGVRQATYDFGGSNILVEGDNGTGKSTIFDAFNWLLFGKDHHGNDQTNFDLKTIDPETLKPIEKVDHSVEAHLTINGNPKSIKRIFRENWVKPKGEVEQVLKGHTSIFIVDGVDVGTKKGYDNIIAEWVKEDLFRLITDPLFFIGESTPWKYRREVLLNLVKGEVNTQAIRDKYADLLKEMNGANMEDFRKVLATKKRETKKMLDEGEVKIRAYTETLPAPADLEKLTEQKNAIEAELNEKVGTMMARVSEIDRMLTDADAMQDADRAEMNHLRTILYDLETQKNALLSDAQNAYRKEAQEKENRIADIKAKIRRQETELNEVNNRLQFLAGRCMGLANDRSSYATSLRELGKAYETEKAKAFTYEQSTKCHACGQELPAETIAEAMEHAQEAFIAEQKMAMNRIIDKANKVKKDIQFIDESLSQYEAEERRLNEKKNQITEESARLAEELAQVENEAVRPYAEREQEIRNGKEFKSYELNVEVAKSKIEKFKNTAPSTEHLTAEKKGLYEAMSTCRNEAEAALQPILDAQARDRTRRETLKLIESGEQRVRELADGLARLERMEFDAINYIKDDVEAQETAINSLFKVARWKMFDQTFDGGIVETCEVMKKDGATFGSMNDAGRIQCGMDVIRVLSWKNDTYAPIFIDNAESITQKDFGTGSQVIRLKVAEGKELTITQE